MKNDKASQSKINAGTDKKILKFAGFTFILLFIVGSIYIIVTKLRSSTIIGSISWCKSGNTIKIEDSTLAAVGIEDYQSQQYEYEDQLCHLKYTKNGSPSELYLDEIALVNFNSKKQKEIGNGCLVYRLEKAKQNAELCFGEKVKRRAKITPTSQRNLAGTNWRYQIDVGGGIGGEMIFDKDEGGSLSGTFTEFGPEGKKEKQFIGTLEKDNFLLTLEEFPTFTVILSPDGKTMAGKPVEETGEIFYPDDFFKATQEQ